MLKAQKKSLIIELFELFLMTYSHTYRIRNRIPKKKTFEPYWSNATTNTVTQDFYT